MPKVKLPEWKNEPLKFAFSPDEALRRGSTVKLTKGRGKSRRKSRN
jgi:hypothetical protein